MLDDMQKYKQITQSLNASSVEEVDRIISGATAAEDEVRGLRKMDRKASDISLETSSSSSPQKKPRARKGKGRAKAKAKAKAKTKASAKANAKAKAPRSPNRTTQPTAATAATAAAAASPPRSSPAPRAFSPLPTNADAFTTHRAASKNLNSSVFRPTTVHTQVSAVAGVNGGCGVM
jgi:hypothetical protein